MGIKTIITWKFKKQWIELKNEELKIFIFVK